MNLYFDTSELIPLLIDEHTTDTINHLWRNATVVESTRLLYPEARAALAMARRMNRLTSEEYLSTLAKLEQLYHQIEITEITKNLANRAGYLADMLALRGYDAVHLASAEASTYEEIVMVTGDKALQKASVALGLPIAPLFS